MKCRALLTLTYIPRFLPYYCVIQLHCTTAKVEYNRDKQGGDGATRGKLGGVNRVFRSWRNSALTRRPSITRTGPGAATRRMARIPT